MTVLKRSIVDIYIKCWYIETKVINATNLLWNKYYLSINEIEGVNMAYSLFENEETLFDVIPLENGELLIKIRYKDFSGQFAYCIENFMIEKYIEALSNLDNQESGELIIDDMDSDSYLIFEKHKYGQMEISGRLGCTFRDNYLIFKFPADQTIIRNLIDRLKCYMKS